MRMTAEMKTKRSIDHGEAGMRARWLLMAVLLAAGSVAVAGGAPPPITIESGAIAGVVEGDVVVYRGIPYAAPPVGELRWRPPQPAPRWEGVRRADEFGPVCPQRQRPDRPGVLGATSEDCLFLNVWTQAHRDDRKLPVMVWIHGGAFIQGAGSWPFYDGAELARQGVVVVTINYRVGRLGFFAHPALTAESPEGPLGNYGLMDQIAALKWVERNIAAFGGDPRNVTIFGESAGGSSVNYLMVSPKSEGLFARAISESGGGFNTPPDIREELPGRGQTVEQMGQAFATEHGISGEDAMARLRALPVEDVLGPAGRLDIRFGPFIDGRVVPGDPGVRFAQGKQHDVPFLVGANSWEGSLAGTFGGTAATVFAVVGDELPRVREVYAKDGITDDDLLAQMLWGDASFVAPARFLAAKMSNVSAPAYLYHFSYVTSGRRGQVPGASHGSEVPYVFQTLDKISLLSGLVNDQDVERSRLIGAYWVQFAKTGDPNGAGRPKWPAYNPDSDILLEFGDSVEQRQGFEKDRLDIHERRYLEKVGLAE